MTKRILVSILLITSLIMTLITGCAPKDKTTDDSENEKFKSHLEQKEEQGTAVDILQ